MEQSKIRKPIVSGQFYPSSAEKLKKQIEGLIDTKATKLDVLACVLPHAGYMYSGGVAGETVSCINIKDKIILLGPNHTGNGSKFSIMSEGVWQTPLGEIKIDSNLAKKILRRSSLLKEDFLAHLHEHSLEVELPFLQFFKVDFEIVPIVVFPEDIEALKEIGKGIADGIKEAGIEDSTIIVASSDLTHYEPQKTAQKKDKEAIQAILELNENKLMEQVVSLNITMCGYAPVIIMLSAAKQLGARRAKLIKYLTSGDVTGEFDSVVGYAGIIIN